MKKLHEYENFDRTMRDLLKVPHSEIKAKLDAEKKAKLSRKRKRKQANDREKGN